MFVAPTPAYTSMYSDFSGCDADVIGRRSQELEICGGILPIVPSQNQEERFPQSADRATVIAVAETIRNTPGLAKLLAQDTSISVVSCSTDGNDLIANCRRLKPCVLIVEASFITTMDFSLLTGPDNSNGSIKLLTIVDQDDSALCKKVLRIGGSGAVQRTAPATVYRRALHALGAGELWVPRATLASLVRELLLDAHPKGLTERQKDILALIAQGYENRRIADSLFVSRDTVRWHIRTIYKKLGVRNRRQAIAHMGGARDFAPTKPVQRAVPASNALQTPNVQG